MAGSPSIEQIVAQIRTAIFGKDVRENIALGIEKCYEDSTDVVKHSEIVNNLEQTDPEKVLDARQGKIISDALTTGAGKIEWQQGFYSTTDGVYHSEYVNYRCSVNRYTRGSYMLLQGWDTVSLSYLVLYKGDTYIGYYNSAAQVYVTRDWDNFGMVVYLPAFPKDFDDIHFATPVAIDERLEEDNRLMNFSLSERPTVIDWKNGFYDPSTGAYDSTTAPERYRCSVGKYPKSDIDLLTGFDYTSSSDFLCLYKDNTFVRTINSGEAIPKYGWNNFTITLCIENNGINLHPQGLTGIYFKSLNPNEGVRHNIIEVSNASSLIQAVQTAIDNESKHMYYDIILKEGTYELWPVLDKTQISGTGDQLYHRGLELPDKCNLYGRGEVTISCAIPESDNSESHPYTRIVSTLNLHNTENILENIRFIGNNTRYCIHDDSGFDDHYKQLIVKNCSFIHLGTASDTYMPSPRCYGAGFTSGRKALFENCIFTAGGNVQKELYVHTHNDTYCESHLELIIDSCAFISTNKGAIDYQVADNSSYGGRVVIKNCYFASGNQIELRGQANSNTRVFGGGNSEVTLINGISANVYLT